MTFGSTRKQNGATLLELMVGLSIVGILASVAVPAYEEHQERVNAADVQKDLGIIAMRIERYFTTNNRYPASLAEIDLDGEDPWGNDYRYYNYATGEGNGLSRQKNNLVPNNSDYELYSIGPDGYSHPHLRTGISMDDIIRGNDGGYLGSVYDYCSRSDVQC